MKTITFNDDNLNISDIDDRIIKARSIIANSDGKVYLSSYNGMYLFPGGKIEDTEDICEGAKREVKEETGIELDFSNKVPFLLIQQFIKNYPKRNTDNDLSNRLNETYYYLVYTDQSINPDKMELMENELNNNFNTIQVGLDEVSSLLINSNTANSRNKYFSREIEIVIKELKKLVNK